MQRISVDFPEPDGPHTTMRSPFITLRLMSLRTWNSPNHLFTPIISTATSPAGVAPVSIRAACESAIIPTPVHAVLRAIRKLHPRRFARQDMTVGATGEAQALPVIRRLVTQVAACCGRSPTIAPRLEVSESAAR